MIHLFKMRLRPIIINLLSLFAATTPCLAQTVLNFDTPGQFAANFNLATQGGGSLGENASAGVGASGGLVRSGSGTGVDKAFAAVFTGQSFDLSGTGTSLTLSFMLQGFDGLSAIAANAKEKGGLRFGLTTKNDPTLTTAKDFFKKDGTGYAPNLHAQFNVDYENKAGKYWKVESEVKNSPASGTEIKSSKVEFAKDVATWPISDPSHWFRLEWAVVHQGSGLFDVTWSVQDWGADGSSYTGTDIIGITWSATNTALSTNPAYIAFTGDMEKNLDPNVAIQYDNLAFTYSPVPEPSTYALLVMGLGAVVWGSRKRRVLVPGLRAHSG